MDYFSAFARYATDCPYGARECWLLLAASGLLAYALTLALLLLRRKPEALCREFHILQSLHWAAAAAGGIVAGGSLYAWADGWFAVNPFQFACLLAFGICLIVSFLGLLGMADKFSRDGFPKFAPQPATRTAEAATLNTLRTRFEASKRLGLLLPLLAVATLPFVGAEQEKLLCFVMDNSASMNEPMESGMVPLRAGKDALARTLEHCGTNVDVLLCYFDETPPKKSNGELFADSPSHLNGTVLFYESDKQDALADISQIATSNVGSPIGEGIWKTYLSAKEHAATHKYITAHMVVVTDGYESALPNFDGMFCDHAEFAGMFAPDQVTLIKLQQRPNALMQAVNQVLGTDAEAFWQKAEACGYTVLDGTTETSYHHAFDTIANETANDPAFPVWLAVFYGLFALAVLFTQTKKIV